MLRVLASPVLATHVLAPLVAGFHERFPSVQLDIEVENHREPQIEQFDITLLGTSSGFDANVIARKINETEGILVASPRYLARRGAPQTPSDLLQHDCLRTKPESLRQRHWTLFRADNDRDRVELDVQPVLWSNHNDTLIRAALDGAGIAATAVELAAPTWPAAAWCGCSAPGSPGASRCTPHCPAASSCRSAPECSSTT